MAFDAISKLAEAYDLESGTPSTTATGMKVETLKSVRRKVKGLEAIYKLRNKDFRGGRTKLRETIQLYELLPEYVTNWSWRGFEQWIENEKDSEMETINQNIMSIIQALNGKKTPEKLRELKRVARWIGKNI